MNKTTYLVETWRNAPYREVLEDTFDSEQFALFFAKVTSQLTGVERTKVFSLAEDGEPVKIAEYE